MRRSSVSPPLVILDEQRGRRARRWTVHHRQQSPEAGKQSRGGVGPDALLGSNRSEDVPE